MSGHVYIWVPDPMPNRNPDAGLTLFRAIAKGHGLWAKVPLRVCTQEIETPPYLFRAGTSAPRVK